MFLMYIYYMAMFEFWLPLTTYINIVYVYHWFIRHYVNLPMQFLPFRRILATTLSYHWLPLTNCHVFNVDIVLITKH